jgi:hypothetical protein
MRWRVQVGLGVIVSVMAAASAASAAVIKVTRTADGETGCTLRAAIADVNSPGAAGPCGSAAAARNTIVLPRADYKLTQAAGDPIYTYDPMVINGNVQRLVIKGAGEKSTVIDALTFTPIFEIQSGASVSIENLTITNGEGPFNDGARENGGAVANAGNLQLSDVAITASIAGQEFIRGSDGTGPLNGEAGGSGGAIYNTGSLSVTGSTLAGNTAGPGYSGSLGGNGGNGGNGGAIDNVGGSLTVMSSTFTKNAAGAAGGAASPAPAGAGGDGGAIATFGGSLIITNSTFTSNEAGAAPGSAGDLGGAVFADGAARVTLLSDTFTANTAKAGGGIGALAPQTRSYSAAGVWMTDILLASNPGGNCSVPDLMDAGANLSFGDTTCLATFRAGNPELRSLHGNGGPTDTIALGNRSAAIGAGVACPKTDQRGVPRPTKGSCDIGACQAVAPRINVVAASTIKHRRVTIRITITPYNLHTTITVRVAGLTKSATVNHLTRSTVTVRVAGLTPHKRYRGLVTATTPDGAARRSFTVN